VQRHEHDSERCPEEHHVRHVPEHDEREEHDEADDGNREEVVAAQRRHGWI